MEKETKTKRIEKYIREQIKSGIWKRGDILPQSKILAKQLNASEFILREAMLPLIREGILGRKPRVGTYVLSEEQVLKGKILLIDVKNIQYNLNNFVMPDTINYEIELIKEKKLDYKVSIATNNIPIKEIIKQLQIDNTYFMKGVLGVVNNIGFLPNSVIKSINVPTVSFNNFYTKRENEVIIDIGSLYYYALNLLSSFSNNIAVFRNDYKVISQIEGEYSKRRNSLIDKNLYEFKSSIVKDVQIDFYNQSYLNIYKIFKNVLVQNPNIDSVFIGDLTFIPAIQHCINDLKIKVPEDLKIICMSNNYVNYGFDFNWTRFEFDHTVGAEIALNILIKKIKGEAVKEKVVVYPKFIKGNSLF